MKYVLSLFLMIETMTFANNNLDWLETLDSPAVHEFVEKQNHATEDRLTKHKDFVKIKKTIQEQIQFDKDLAAKRDAIYVGEFAYQIKKNDEHVKGLWRRTNKKSHQEARRSGNYDALKWEVLLDVSKIAIEKKLSGLDLAWKSFRCFRTDSDEYNQCLIFLSHSGSDASIVLEYDLKNKEWRKDRPLEVPVLGKHTVHWIDEDSVLIQRDDLAIHNASHPEKPLDLASAATKNLVSNSGYPINTYALHRGQNLLDLKPIFQVPSTSMSAWLEEVPRYKKDEPNDQILFFSEKLNFFESKYTLATKNANAAYDFTALDFPPRAQFLGFTDQHDYLFKLDQKWQGFPSDSIIAIGSTYRNKSVTFTKPTLVYKPEEARFLRYADVDRGKKFDPSDDLVIVSTLKNVVPNSYLFTKDGKDGWKQKELRDPVGLEFPEVFLWKEEGGGDIHYVTQNFLEPPREYVIGLSKNKDVLFEEIDRDPNVFDAEKFKVAQLWVDQGKDENGAAIKVPYFIAYDPKKVKLEGNQIAAPAIITAYGGFQISFLPRYLKYEGRFILENGGVWVLAGLRGGGEFGPYWHQSALKSNRQKVYDDLIAVAEDLIKRGITNPKKLGISGGSNGGLLVAAAMVQRPELFNAVYCAIPLLDMLRYHKLLAGASWMAEYGDPEGAEKGFWLKTSPLHNLHREKTYPPIFLQTNRFDDRVHPAHARKMAKALSDLGKDFYFYEDQGGGHGGTDKSSADQAHVRALYFTYLLQRLF